MNDGNYFYKVTAVSESGEPIATGESTVEGSTQTIHLDFGLLPEGATGVNWYVGELAPEHRPTTLWGKLRYRFATLRFVPEWYNVYRKGGSQMFRAGTRAETKKWWQRWSE